MQGLIFGVTSELFMRWALGILAFGLLAWGTQMRGLVASLGYPRPERFKSPIMAVELAKRPEEIQLLFPRVVREKRSAAIIRSTEMDNFFIVLYVSVIVGIIVWAVWLQPSAVVARFIGVAGILCILLAAFFDFRENRAIIRLMLQIKTSADEVLTVNPAAVRCASLMKWWFFFTSLPLVALCLRPHARVLETVLATLLVISGGWGIFGLLLTEAWIEYAMVPLLVGMVLCALVLPFRPGP